MRLMVFRAIPVLLKMLCVEGIRTKMAHKNNSKGEPELGHLIARHPLQVEMLEWRNRFSCAISGSYVERE
jgi:hypothetical protein